MRPQELFQSTVGPLRTASLSYDAKGHSKGIATVQFVKAVDATKAYQQYNKRLIDGSGSPFLLLSSLPLHLPSPFVFSSSGSLGVRGLETPGPRA